MLKYIGSDEYEFYNSKNQKIILTRDDIDTIISLVPETDGLKVDMFEKLKEKNEHWRELYYALKNDITNLKSDLQNLIDKG